MHPARSPGSGHPAVPLFYLRVHSGRYRQYQERSSSRANCLNRSLSHTMPGSRRGLRIRDAKFKWNPYR